MVEKRTLVNAHMTLLKVPMQTLAPGLTLGAVSRNLPAGWLSGWLAGWLAGWLDGCLPGCLAAWLPGCLAAWLPGLPAGWLSGWPG